MKHVGSILAVACFGTLTASAQYKSINPSREIARYVKKIGERCIPSMTVNLAFRADRFGRDGDQRSFYREGFGAVRFSTPVENFANEHSATDTFDGTSSGFITRVT